MKVIGFNGSPRKDGNTSIMIDHLLGEISKEGIETEVVRLADKEIRGCIACYRCFENKDHRCAVKNDAVNEYIEKMEQAQGIVLASPVYFQDVTTEMKALIDRVGFVSIANGGMYRNKVGAALATFRRSGASHVVDSINHFFLSAEVIIVGRANGMGREKGEVKGDEEGMHWATTLGQRMAWLLKKLEF